MTTPQVLNFHVPKVFKFRMPLTVGSFLRPGAAKTLRLQHTPVHVRDGTLSGRQSVGARHVPGPASCPRRLEGSHPARGDANAIRRARRTRNTGACLDKRGAQRA
jgi:hypothetical protein